MQDIDVEQVWLTVLQPSEAATYDDVARIAGIEPLGKAWIEISRSEARALLSGLLHRSLPYQAELMPRHRADWLAGEFIDAFGPYGGRFATNGVDRGWTPATDYVMDRGLVVMSEIGSGIFWVADED
ncbi:hypothetical protein ACFVJS_25215 [Nocardioides sp. NPDC057772]|uniref:hypothetical protein n=1 Tax=Nocardioides sp. NPDC057772 TaxID=3346245 RepID=UPI00366D1CAD